MGILSAIFGHKDAVSGRAASLDEIRGALLKVRGASDRTRIECLDPPDTAYFGVSWRTMQGLYGNDRVRLHIPSAYDCEDRARRKAASVGQKWAEMIRDGQVKHPLGLPHGIAWGMFPLDGDYSGTGPHALNWFLDDSLDFWLYSAWEGSVKSRGELGLIRSVWQFEVW